MDLAFLNEYMSPIVIGVCLCIGYVCKNIIPSNIINRWIPTIVAVLGVVLSCWIHNWAFTPEIMLGGLVSGLASTGMHQLFSQFIDKTN